MCRGKEEQPSQGGFRRPETHRDVVSAHATVVCELCKSLASLYCQADDAFLCRKCDKWVHGANFLAQRHIRCFLCSTCQGLTKRYLVGVHRSFSFRPWRAGKRGAAGVIQMSKQSAREH